MKRRVCELASKGLEEGVPQGEGSYIQLDANLKPESACYLGMVALGAGIPQNFKLDWEAGEETYNEDGYPDDYAEALEAAIDLFIHNLYIDGENYVELDTGDKLMVSKAMSCPLGDGCEDDYQYRVLHGTTSIIVHLNDKHHFTIEQINETLRLLGYC